MAEPALFSEFTKPLYMQASKLRGGIKRVMTLNCTTPTYIYVETLLPAALDAIWGVLLPDPKEAYHKVAGKSLVCTIKGSIAQGFTLANVEPGPLTRFAFTSLELFDLATWWFFLADVAVEGLANWTSAIYRQTICPDQHSPHWATGPEWTAGMRLDGADYITNYAWVSGDGVFGPGDSTVFVQPGKGYVLACTMVWDAGFGTPVPCTAHMTIADTNIVLDTDAGDNDRGIAQRATHVWSRGSNTIGTTMRVKATWSYLFAADPGKQAFPWAGKCHGTKFVQP